MATKKPNELVTRTEAAKLLAKIVGDEQNTVTSRIGYAVNKQRSLRRVSGKKEVFTAADLGSWAAKKWPNHAAAIGKILPIPTVLEVHSATMGLTSQKARIHQPPGTLAECQARLAEREERIAQLEGERDALRDECERLRPIAKKKAETSKKLSDAGRRAKGVPKRER